MSAVSPANFNQAGFWTLEQLDAPVNAWRFWKIEGALDLSALESACTALAGRHQLLHSAFVLDDGQVLQQTVQGHVPLDFEVADLRAASDADAQAHAEAMRAAGQPFDLTRAPLLRWRVWRTSAHRSFLLIAAHHIIVDGWSWGVLHRDLSHLYEQAASGAAPGVPAVLLPFSDFAARERMLLAAAHGQASFARARDALVDVPVLALPRDRSGGEPGRRAARYHFSIPAQQSARLRQLAHERQVTTFAAWLALFALCLARQTGQFDFALGVAAANRADPDSHSVIGPLATVVPVRLRMLASQTFDELLTHASSLRQDVQARQGQPFDWFAQELGVGSRQGRVPLVQAMISYRNMPDDGLVLHGADAVAELLEPGIETSIFDLLLELVPGPAATQACLVYRSSEFDAGTMALSARRMERLLIEVCDNPARPLGEFPVLGLEEERAILHQWAGDVAGGERELTIHAAFGRQVRLRPDAVALLTGGRSVRYRELDALSNDMRARLVASGVRSGAIVGVGFAPGLDFIVALLGILKCGAAYLPLDLADPAGRVDALLAQAECLVVVGAPEHRTRLPARVLLLCGDESRQAGGAVLDKHVEASSADGPAYVMFTSGSTGVPKGVVVPHRGIVRLVVDPGWAGLAPQDVFLLQSATSFDASTFEIWGALLNGACLVIPQARLLTCHAMKDTLRANGVTVLFLTTSVYNMFAGEDIECLQGLRLLIVGGEAINAVHVETGLRHLPGCRIVNAYGPTENTAFTCTHEVARVEPGRPIPIGRPIDRTLVFILDAEANILPVGATGELHTGGDGLALGYLGDPGMTAAKFIEVPAEKLGRAGAAIRLYRTGDLARWRPDGLVEYLGRADRQVKLRGFRIELGEIETVLLRFPGVRQATARLWEGAGGPRLIAYTVGGADAQEVRRWARDRLPAWMVPDDFMPVGELPLRSTGKIDIEALPLPYSDPVDQPIREATALESRVAATMAAVLGCSSIGPDEDFYARGGNSLRAIQFLGRLESDFGCRLPVADFLQQPTAKHAAHLLARTSTDEFPREIEVLRRGAGGAPIFFAHSIAGSSLYASAYVPYLPPSSPVYGLRMCTDRGPAPASLEATASQYAHAIRAVQAQGPYHLAGYSFGAHLAFEIAHQLSVAGDRLGVLAIIDSTPMFEPDALHMGADLPGTPESDSKRMLADYCHSAFGARVLLLRSEARLNEPLLQPGGSWEVFALDGVDTLRLPGDHAAAVREPAARVIGDGIRQAMTHAGDSPTTTRANPGEAAWEAAAITLARQRQPAALLEHYRARLREGKDLPPWAIVEYGDLCAAAGHADEREALLTRLEGAGPLSQSQAFALALARRRQGRPQQAAPLFERAAVGGELALGPLLHLFQISMESAATDDAITYAQRATECAPRSIAARRSLADALLAADRKAEALQALNAAIAIDGSDAQLRHLRSQVLAGFRRLQPARDDARAAALLRPQDPHYQAHLQAVTADIERMAHGEITMAAALPKLHAGGQAQLEVEVHNRSGQTWGATGPDGVLLSYHWTRPDGTSLVRDGIRTRMPAAIEPGGRLLARINVTCPQEPGQYGLELTAVQENVVWFESSSLFRACRMSVVLGH